jgi:ribosomal protein S18 acetylase RimI-like enzyme
MASATSPDNKEIEVISMWVAPEARRNGVGTALVAAIVSWALEQDVVRVVLDAREGNSSAIDLYRRCGFTDVGQSPNSDRDAPERRMVRVLG